MPLRFELLLALTLLSASPALAQDVAEDEGVHHVTPPPPPETLPPDVTLEIRGAAIAPLFRDTICPANHECVFNAGVGVGVSVERRWPDGWGFLARYDAWVIDAGSLYEIGIMNSARVGARYILDSTSIVHPYLEALVGFLAFGNSTTVAAAGGSVTGGAGTEIELNDSLVLDIDAELWALATSFFATRDGVRRSDGFGPNLALQISIGLQVLLGSL